MKNTINDLNNTLFGLIEALDDDDLKGEKLKEQLQKSTAINNIARTLIASASVSLNYLKHCTDYAIDEEENAPTLLKHDKLVIQKNEQEMLQQRS